MGQRATLNHTPGRVRQSVRAYWKRSVGITWPLVRVLLTAYLIAIVRDGMSTLRAMGPPQGTLDIDEEGLTVASEAGRASLPWRSVKEVWRGPGFWLLMRSPSQYVTLPLGDLPEGMRAEILSRVQQHGGKAR
jgi:YcxB-like protein